MKTQVESKKNVSAYSSQPICIAFLDRKCSGKDCTKWHVKLCNKFQSGGCKRKDCKFEHIMRPTA